MTATETEETWQHLDIETNKLRKNYQMKIFPVRTHAFTMLQVQKLLQEREFI